MSTKAWNLETLVFEEERKPENPEKNPQSRDENKQQTQPTYDVESNRTRATLVGGERSKPLRHPCSPVCCTQAYASTVLWNNRAHD